MQKRHVLNSVLASVLFFLCTIFTTPIFAASIGPNQSPSPLLSKTGTKANPPRESGPAEARKAGIIKTYGKLPLYFIKNQGQVNGQVSFYERGAGHATFFTSEGVVLALTKSDGKIERPSLNDHTKDFEINKDKVKEAITEAVRLSFVGANKEAKITAEGQMPGHVNYGSSPK